MRTLAVVMLVAVVVLTGCATPGRWVPIADPQAGVHYPCCWYPHGYWKFVPDTRPGADKDPKNFRTLAETKAEDGFPQNNDHPFPGMVRNTPDGPVYFHPATHSVRPLQ